MQLNCSLQMPVEPTDKIFEQFEMKLRISSSMRSTATDEEESSSMKPLCIGLNHSLKVLYHWNDKNKSCYAFIKCMSQLVHKAMKAHYKKVCVLLLCMHFLQYPGGLLGPLNKKHPMISSARSVSSNDLRG